MWGLLRYTKIYNKKSPWRYQHQGDITRTPKSIIGPDNHIIPFGTPSVKG